MFIKYLFYIFVLFIYKLYICIIYLYWIFLLRLVFGVCVFCFFNVELFGCRFGYFVVVKGFLMGGVVGRDVGILWVWVLGMFFV